MNGDLRLFSSIFARASLLLLLAATPVVAQSGGTIRGTVVDGLDNALPGVRVTATGDGVDAETVTDAAGAYEFAALAPGEYVVTASLFGYAAREVPVTVRAGAVETVPIVLQPAFLLDPISVVAEEPAVFARNYVAEPMMRQQSSITAVTSVIDNLPGVSVQEGDAYSFDDWSSNVVMRGFQSTINDVQIGTTIDGFPNGTSDYWSGAKANRFVDPINLGGVEVSQGTADIASRSVEALGGTLNFLTSDPSEEASRTASVTIGENEGQRFAARVETGSMFGGTTRAWVSAIRQAATDWMEGSARNEREHFAAKIVSSHGNLDLTGYLSYDDIHEDVYQRLYSDADFRADPRWDRLIGPLAGRALPEPVLPARLADAPQEHARLRQGRLVRQRAGPPSAWAHTAIATGDGATGCPPTSSTWWTTGADPSRSWRGGHRCAAAPSWA